MCENNVCRMKIVQYTDQTVILRTTESYLCTPPGSSYTPLAFSVSVRSGKSSCAEAENVPWEPSEAEDAEA